MEFERNDIWIFAWNPCKDLKHVSFFLFYLLYWHWKSLYSQIFRKVFCLLLSIVTIIKEGFFSVCVQEFFHCDNGSFFLCVCPGFFLSCWSRKSLLLVDRYFLVIVIKVIFCVFLPCWWRKVFLCMLPSIFLLLWWRKFFQSEVSYFFCHCDKWRFVCINKYSLVMVIKAGFFAVWPNIFLSRW